MSSNVDHSSGLTWQVSSFAKGQQPPTAGHAIDAPLDLLNVHYDPRREQHPPPGVLTDEMLPEGTPRPKLFDPVALPQSELQIKNRIIVSPMCQYSSVDGFPTPYHIAHLGAFALHGAGTIVVEASGVEARGRITPEDVGIWKDEHIAAHASLVTSLKTMAAGLTMGIQLAHAGRKASTWSPYWRGPKPLGWPTEEDKGWPNDVVAPSAISYDNAPSDKKWIVPRQLSTEEVDQMQEKFVAAADRAFAAGYDFIELHAAHGYLMHSFLSPLSNKRTDKYGGSFENRTRLLVETAQAIKAKHPSKSIWVRVSSTDYAEHLEKEQGVETWNIESTKKLAPLLAHAGVCVLDCSAGGLVSVQKIKPGPAYQLPYASAVRALRIPRLLIGSVGILEGDEFPGQLAEKALQDDQANLIFLARGIMAHPSWPEDAAQALTGGVRCAGNPAYHRVHPAKSVKPAALNNN